MHQSCRCVISHTIFSHWMCLQRTQLFPGTPPITMVAPYHPITMCWFYVLCPCCLRISSHRADSELQQGMAGRWGKETPALVAEHGKCHLCPLLLKQTSSFLWGRCSDQEAVVYSREAEGKEPWPPCQKLFLLARHNEIFIRPESRREVQHGHRLVLAHTLSDPANTGYLNINSYLN